MIADSHSHLHYGRADCGVIFFVQAQHFKQKSMFLYITKLQEDMGRMQSEELVEL